MSKQSYSIEWDNHSYYSILDEMIFLPLLVADLVFSKQLASSNTLEGQGEPIATPSLAVIPHIPASALWGCTVKWKGDGDPFSKAISTAIWFESHLFHREDEMLLSNIFHVFQNKQKRLSLDFLLMLVTVTMPHPQRRLG